MKIAVPELDLSPWESIGEMAEALGWQCGVIEIEIATDKPHPSPAYEGETEWARDGLFTVAESDGLYTIQDPTCSAMLRGAIEAQIASHLPQGLTSGQIHRGSTTKSWALVADLDRYHTATKE